MDQSMAGHPQCFILVSWLFALQDSVGVLPHLNISWGGYENII